MNQTANSCPPPRSLPSIKSHCPKCGRAMSFPMPLEPGPIGDALAVTLRELAKRVLCNGCAAAESVRMRREHQAMSGHRPAPNHTPQAKPDVRLPYAD